MKKFSSMVLAVLLCVGMFTGCGTSYKADESTVFVLKDGKIVSTDVETFDEKAYDKDGLKDYVKKTINDYNEKNGKKNIALKNLNVNDKKAALTISYDSADDYEKFNDIELYTGSIAEALAAGYSFEGDFASVAGGKIKACENSAFLDDSSYKVVVIKGNTNVKVKGTIAYVSTANTRYVDAQTIEIQDGNSLLAKESATESTQEATEAETENTQAQEVTGAVSDDDLLNATEEESEVTFDFKEDDTKTKDSIKEFSQVYTYIIYK